MRITGILLLSLFFLPYTTSGHRIGGTSLFSDEEIRSLASQQYQLFNSTDTVNVYDNKMVVETGQRVFDAIKKYSGPRKLASELKNYVWQIKLINKKDVNAFCLPGARVVVGTAMLEWAQNEGSVAVVLAHQAAHILLGHGEERLEHALKEMTGGKKLSQLLTEKPAIAKDIFLAAYGAGNVALLSPFSLEQEKKADKLGMILVGLAGFNPRETIVFWERMERQSRTASQPVLMSAHRYNRERFDAMQEIVDEMVRKYYTPKKG